MADDDELEAAKRRRPPTTIDVTATEIASEPADSPESTETVDGTATPGSSSAKDSHSPEAGKSGAGDPVAPSRSRVAEIFNRNIMIAAASGAAVMFVLLAALAVFFLLDARARLSARIAILETQARAFAARPQPAAIDPRALAGLDSRIAKAEASAAAPRDVLADKVLMDRVATLETAVRDSRSRADAALQAAQKNAEKPQAPAVAPAALESLSARVAALEQAAKSTSDKVAHVAAVSAGQDRAGRLAFVAITLREAVSRGEPYVRELAAAKQLVSDAAVIAPLEPFAATGVPRSAALARELSQLAGPMISAAGASPREGGILERLQQSTERLVRIRPLGAAPGDEPAAVVARAEAKATQGDLSGAVADLKTLPESVRAPAQGWIRKAESQIAAVAAARALAENAIGALGRATP